MAVPQKMFVRSSQVTNHGFMRMSLKQSQSSVWVFELEPNPTKIICEKITSKQMVACFFCKIGPVASVQLQHRRTVNPASIGVEKQTQMMVVHQKILSAVMLKHIKLCYGNARFHLATPEIC